MIKLIIKNLKEVELPFRQETEKIINEKLEFYQKLFKNIDKDLTIRSDF